jgi:hypothetical protein
VHAHKGKLELTVRSYGEPTKAPVYVQGLTPYIGGDVCVRLDKPEPVSQIRIRIKGVARSTVFRANSQGRKAVVDEFIFFETSSVLWEAQSEEELMHGVQTLPFEFVFPEEMPLHLTGGKAVPLPPSFSLGIPGVGISELASIKYYIVRQGAAPFSCSQADLSQ